MGLTQLGSASTWVAYGPATTVNVTWPTGYSTRVANDLAIMVGHLKRVDATIPTPSGWDLLATVITSSNGAAYAASTGDTKSCIFVRKLAGGEGSVPLAVMTGGSTGSTAGNVALVTIHVYRADTGEYDVASFGAAQSASASSWSQTSGLTAETAALPDSTTDVGVGDQFILSSAITSTSKVVNSVTLSGGGLTYAAMTSRPASTGTTPNGADLLAHAVTTSVTAGTASSPTLTLATSLSSGSYGTMVGVRVREAVPGPSTVTGGTAQETDTAHAGTVQTGALVGGGTAHETDAAQAGTTTSGALNVAGGTAHETDTASAGGVSNPDASYVAPALGYGWSWRVDLTADVDAPAAPSVVLVPRPIVAVSAPHPTLVDGRPT